MTDREDQLIARGIIIGAVLVTITFLLMQAV